MPQNGILSRHCVATREDAKRQGTAPAAFLDVAPHELLSHSDNPLLRMNMLSHGAWREGCVSIFSVNREHISNLVEPRMI